MTEISSLVLCWRKVHFAHLPSPKYFILVLILVLGYRKVCFAHLPAPKYFILCFYFWYFDAVRFALLTFLHQSTLSYVLFLVLLMHSTFLLCQITSQYCQTPITYNPRTPTVRPAIICIAFSRIQLQGVFKPEMSFLSTWLEWAKKLVCLMMSFLYQLHSRIVQK